MNGYLNDRKAQIGCHVHALRRLNAKAAYDAAVKSNAPNTAQLLAAYKAMPTQFQGQKYCVQCYWYRECQRIKGICKHCAHNKNEDLFEPDGHGAQYEKANPGSIRARKQWFIENNLEMPPDVDNVEEQEEEDDENGEEEEEENEA